MTPPLWLRIAFFLAYVCTWATGIIAALWHPEVDEWIRGELGGWVRK